MIALTAKQTTVITAGQSSFLLGPAGTGKSTSLTYRVVNLLEGGVPAYTLLVLVAEPEHVQSFLDRIHESGLGPYAELSIHNYNNLARQMVTLFWPLVARPAGFDRPYQPPTFLSYDLAQLLMWRVITPMVAEGAFAGLRLRPQQIVSQLLDTLNRAALNGLTLDDAVRRQIETAAVDKDSIRHLQDAAEAARHFRHRCLKNNLLDLSLVVQVFDTHLVKHPEFRKYFSERYRHLIVDNAEEQTPAGQQFIVSLMETTETATIAYDAGGGYKRFLGADPTGARKLSDRCQEIIEFDEPCHIPSPLIQLSNMVEDYLLGAKLPTAGAEEAIIHITTGRYRREMIIELARVLATLIDDGLAASEIAIIAPYLDGALRYLLAKELKEFGLPYYILRRRSSPRDEPRVRAWLTWLALAHPDWGVRPAFYDVAEALNLSLASLDPARAQLVAESLYELEGPFLRGTHSMPGNIAERVGYKSVQLVETLRSWLDENGGSRYPIDVFLHRLFNTLLAQPSFQPKPDLVGAAVCDWLIRTANRLRRAAQPMGLDSPSDVGRAFIESIYQGLVTADPPELGEPPNTNGIMISTIYGYLLAGDPVKVQVWLEAAATGWWDIPRQPLSNAFVLAQSWPAGQQWTMEEDFKIRNQLLSRIMKGLANRCTEGVILANSDLDRRGIRQDGPLWRALYPIREGRRRLEHGE